MEFKSDIQIAQEAKMDPITQVAKDAGIDEKYVELYGNHKAKIDYNILKDRKDTLNFFVYAPEEVRIQATMEKKNIGRKEAAELVKYHDEMLHSRYKYMTGSYRGDRKGRHMMIDSSVLGWEKTAQYMLQMIDLRFED